MLDEGLFQSTAVLNAWTTLSIPTEDVVPGMPIMGLGAKESELDGDISLAEGGY